MAQSMSGASNQLLVVGKREAELLRQVKVEAIPIGDLDASQVDGFDKLVTALHVEDTFGGSGRPLSLLMAGLD